MRLGGMSHPSLSLSERIEELVREHLEATRRAAVAAVERAFASTPSTLRTRRDTPRTTSRASAGRRSPADLSALAERLHEAVCAHPGETMSVLAATLGARSRELERPVKALRRMGRVRSVGQRHLTRYYPTVARSVARGS
ncbi:MAG: winged helix-turn-helix domain-containing protein [Kofleriaceae bacterium]